MKLLFDAKDNFKEPLFEIKDSFEENILETLNRFIRSAHNELIRAGYHSFSFKVRNIEEVICVYLLYDLEPDESSKLLSWHIYLQEKLIRYFKRAKILDSIAVFIIEAYDLWDQ